MVKRFTMIAMMLCACCTSFAANYLTFTAEEDGSTFKTETRGDYTPAVHYSLDDGATWIPLTPQDTVSLPKKGDKALLKGENPNGFSRGEMEQTNFIMTGAIAASGSVMSLIDGTGDTDSIPCDACFKSLFIGCASLTNAPELPATKLTEHCYENMFSACEKLTQTPELPATKLAPYCYRGMFFNCDSLKKASELPATTLAEECYNTMFWGCASLAKAPSLPATTLADICYHAMFQNCTSLTEAPELPATTLAEACYQDMFYNCRNLTKAPKLPATTLAEGCYGGMFDGCSSLTQAPELPATKLEKCCYISMFAYCTALEKAPQLPATDLEVGCYSSMFAYCTGLTKAPELPATTMKGACYEGMFLGCSNLTEAPELPATALTDKCYRYMFQECTNLSRIRANFSDWAATDSWVLNVAPTGTFICPKALAEEHSIDRIPEGWNVEYIESTDLDDTSTDNCNVWTDGHTLFVNNAQGVIEVYSLNGQLLHSVNNIASIAHTFTLPAHGTYIVKVGSQTVKVVH